MNKTVYVVIKSGIVTEAYGPRDIDVVVLDYDTDDELMKEELNKQLDKIQSNPNLGELEIY